MKPATNRLFGWSYRNCGVSTCWRTPLRMTATRSPIVMASTWSCVTYSVVTRRSCWIRAISERIWTRSLASRFDSGSSMRNALGSRTMARPMATRCRCPPDRAFGFRDRNSWRPRIPAASRTRLSISSLGSFRSFSPKPMLSFLRRQRVDDAVADPDRPLADALEPRDHPERRGLAAPRRAHEHDELSVVDVEVQVGDRRGPIREYLRHLLHDDLGHGSPSDGVVPMLSTNPVRPAIRGRPTMAGWSGSSSSGETSPTSGSMRW